MSTADIIALLPLLLLASTTLLALLLVAVGRHHRAMVGLTLTGLALVCCALPFAAAAAPRLAGPLLVIDRFALLYMAFVAMASAAVAAISYAYLERREEDPEEFYVLLLLAALGSSVLVASRHVATLFLGLETLSVSLYAMIGYLRQRRRSVEAAIKYLVLAAVSSAFLLLGAALLYAVSGTLDLAEVAAWASAAEGRLGWPAAGAALLLVGFGFKLALVPFHMWTPDVYEGAPAPAAGFVAAVSKGAVLALVTRLLALVGPARSEALVGALAILAVASMVFGNILALLQPNLKRLLAYSSIAHMGYALVAVLVAGPMAAEAVTFYLVAYMATVLAAFGVIATRSDATGDRDRLEDYRGLFWRRPFLAALLAVAMVSLAGLPVTAGFMAKYYVVAAGVGAGLWVPVLALIATSVLSLFYYLRVVVTMAGAPEAGSASVEPAPSVLGGTALAMLLALIVVAGALPSGLMAVAGGAAGAVGQGWEAADHPLRPPAVVPTDNEERSRTEAVPAATSDGPPRPTTTDTGRMTWQREKDRHTGRDR